MLGLHYIDADDGWVSECCFAYPIGELDHSTDKYGGPSGFCGRCHDNCILLVEDTGDHFDTVEEKHGER